MPTARLTTVVLRDPRVRRGIILTRIAALSMLGFTTFTLLTFWGTLIGFVGLFFFLFSIYMLFFALPEECLLDSTTNVLRVRQTRFLQHMVEEIPLDALVGVHMGLTTVTFVLATGRTIKIGAFRDMEAVKAQLKAFFVDHLEFVLLYDRDPSDPAR